MFEQAADETIRRTHPCLAKLCAVRRVDRANRHPQLERNRDDGRGHTRFDVAVAMPVDELRRLAEEGFEPSQLFAHRFFRLEMQAERNRYFAQRRWIRLTRRHDRNAVESA
jgi:hypothetical protein